MAQLVRGYSLFWVFHFAFIKVGDHQGLEGQALEREVSVVEGKGQVDVS